jgi:RNA polymerase sigma-70 factor (ECF subfamily)
MPSHPEIILADFPSALRVLQMKTHMIAVLDTLPQFGSLRSVGRALPSPDLSRSIGDSSASPRAVSGRSQASINSRKASPAANGRLDTCIQHVQEGDEDAARELMDHLYPLVLKLVRAYLPRRTSEEDLVQTVFMKIFSRLDQYSHAVPIEHWVSRVTINTCLNEIKAERIRPEWRWADLSEEHHHVIESLAAVEDEPKEHCSAEAKALLQRLFECLKPKDRLVIQLLHLEQKSIAEISRVTGWSKAVVKVRAFRARKKLQDRLSALEAAPRNAKTPSQLAHQAPLHAMRLQPVLCG